MTAKDSAPDFNFQVMAGDDVGLAESIDRDRRAGDGRTPSVLMLEPLNAPIRSDDRLAGRGVLGFGHAQTRTSPYLTTKENGPLRRSLRSPSSLVGSLSASRNGPTKAELAMRIVHVDPDKKMRSVGWARINRHRFIQGRLAVVRVS